MNFTVKVENTPAVYTHIAIVFEDIEVDEYWGWFTDEWAWKHDKMPIHNNMDYDRDTKQLTISIMERGMKQRDITDAICWFLDAMEWTIEQQEAFGVGCGKEWPEEYKKEKTLDNLAD